MKGGNKNMLQILKKGVYIVINGQVFNPDNVRKNLEKNIFETIN